MWRSLNNNTKKNTKKAQDQVILLKMRRKTQQKPVSQQPGSINRKINFKWHTRIILIIGNVMRLSWLLYIFLGIFIWNVLILISFTIFYADTPSIVTIVFPFFSRLLLCAYCVRLGFRGYVFIILLMFICAAVVRFFLLRFAFIQNNYRDEYYVCETSLCCWSINIFKIESWLCAIRVLLWMHCTAASAVDTANENN